MLIKEHKGGKKRIQRRSNYRHIAFIDWKIQHSKDVNSLQIDP